MLADFHFLRSEWLWAIPLVIIFAIMLSRRQLAAGSWQRVVDPALLPFVLARKAASNLSYRWWLLALGGVIAVLALAGPSWERVEQPVFRSEQAVVIALDLSRSMDAQDVAPSRLTRARLKILDILAARSAGQSALVVFSSNAFTVTPLTTDSDTVATLVNSLSTDIMPSRGSYPVAAIEKGLQLLQQAGVGFGEVLLITDGGTSPAAEDAARTVLDNGYTLSVLGVGTAEGAPIPRAGGGFVTDRAGNVAIPRLQIRQLQRLARAGGGDYVTLTTDNSDIERLLSAEVQAGSTAGQSHATDQWQEEGPWLVLLLLPFAALAFRKGLVFCFLLCTISIAQPVFAFEWNDLWLNADQQGQKKLREGLADEAALLFENRQWRSVASYEAGQYAESAAGFAENGNAESLYNLGNAMARLGEFEPAIDAYNESLELRPGDEDTTYNRNLVAQLLQQQQEQNQQEGGEQSESESGGESENSESGEEGDQQQADSGDSEGEKQDGDSTREESESSEEDMQAMQEELQRAAEQAAQEQGEMPQQAELTEEQLQALRQQQEETQAMEQWLRRVENDPGGLLRRKFRYQYQKQGVDQDGNSVWPDDDVEPW